MLDKVLILSASAGAGHLRAADAIEKAFRQTGGARDVRHVDTLEFTNKIFRELYSKLYIELVNKTPQMLGWLYDYLDRPWKQDPARLAFDQLNTRPFVRMLREYDPDLVVCTHFLPSEIISWLRSKGKSTCRQAIVVTDFDVHAMWLCRNYEHYFVALDETRVHLEKLGVPARKITVSGIPIDPIFAEAKNQAQTRLKLGFDADRTTILLSAGGFGVGPIQRLVASLLQVEHPVQVAALCGKNEKLRLQVESIARAAPSTCQVHIHAIAFTRAMDEYMAASDLVLGKTGGLTTSEALAKGLAFVIVNPIPGQEERNSDHLLEQGVAVRCNNLPVLAHKIDQLLADPNRLATMRQNALRLAKPRAAFTVVETLLELGKTFAG